MPITEAGLRSSIDDGITKDKKRRERGTPGQPGVFFRPSNLFPKII